MTQDIKEKAINLRQQGLTYEDVEKAGQEGNALFEKWLEEQAAIKDKYLCDCHRNYGKDCLFPDKYRKEGCS